MRTSFALAAIKPFLRDRSAVSALEFALVLPIMLTLYMGGVELGSALTIDRKVTQVTSTLADLVTQSKALSTSDMQNIFDAATSIIAPYTSTPLTMKVTEVKIDSTGKATVAWSVARNDTALTTGATVTLPTAVATPSTWVVMSEVHYPYTPSIGYVMTGTYDLSDKFYLRPRLVSQVCLNSVC